MAFIAATNTAKACFDFTWKGVGVSICIYFLKATAPSSSDFQDLAFSLRDEFTDNVMPVLSHDVLFNGVTVYDMSSETAPIYTATETTPVAGGVAVDGTSRQVTAVITHRTAVRGRSGRGRTYLPGLSDNDVVDGAVTTDAQTAIQDAWDAFITAVETAVSWTFAVVSFYHDGAPRASGVKIQVTSSVVRGYTGTQRRRNPVG